MPHDFTNFFFFLNTSPRLPILQRRFFAVDCEDWVAYNFPAPGNGRQGLQRSSPRSGNPQFRAEWLDQSHADRGWCVQPCAEWVLQSDRMSLP